MRAGRTSWRSSTRIRRWTRGFRPRSFSPYESERQGLRPDYTEQGGCGGDALAAGNCLVDGRHRPGDVEVVVEGGPYLVDRGLAFARGAPPLEALHGGGQEDVVPLPCCPVVVGED